MGRFGAGARLSFAGGVAVGAALAVGELLAGILSGVPSPLLAVARFFVDIQPPGAKELVVALFGEADKIAFQVLIVIVALGVGALVGRLADRRPTIAAAVIGGFVTAGFLASLREPGVGAVFSAAVAGIQALVGIQVLDRLVGIAKRPSVPSARAKAANGMPDWGRRSLLQVGGALAIGSFFAGAAGRYLLERQRTPVDAGGGPTAPTPADLPPGADIATADLAGAGLTPIVVPNDGFYRIDTAFVVPTVDRATWTLKVVGLVDREVTL